jgi:hypothetical protein
VKPHAAWMKFIFFSESVLIDLSSQVYCRYSPTGKILEECSKNWTEMVLEHSNQEWIQTKPAELLRLKD